MILFHPVVFTRKRHVASLEMFQVPQINAHILSQLSEGFSAALISKVVQQEKDNREHYMLKCMFWWCFSVYHKCLMWQTWNETNHKGFNKYKPCGVLESTERTENLHVSDVISLLHLQLLLLLRKLHKSRVLHKDWGEGKEGIPMQDYCLGSIMSRLSASHINQLTQKISDYRTLLSQNAKPLLYS